jgi:hypothetical protein
MIAADVKGPVDRSALFISRAGEEPPHLPTRRRIGSGVRPVYQTSPARIATRRRVAPPEARSKPMKKRSLVYTAILATGLSLAAVGLRAAVDTTPTLMSPVDFGQVKKGIEANARLALARCRDATGSDREVCRAEARAEERIQKAELEARYFGTVTAQNAARSARVKASYEVAKARCGAQLGEGRVECLRAAREERKLLAQNET